MKYTKEHQEKATDLLKTLVEKAWESAAFKDQLLKNPLATIQEFTNEKFSLPDNKRIVVEDQSDESVIYFNIPAQPNFDEFELTDEQLETIAGGEVAATAGLVLACIGLFGAGVGIGLAIK
nr:NHLP leader peptide family RiPP precursor [uncultured Flavobacterium sp.]